MSANMCSRMRPAASLMILSLVLVNECMCRTNSSNSTGSRQSPINIVTVKTKPLRECCNPHLNISYKYLPDSSFTVFNDGYTVEFVPNSNASNFTVTGGPLKSEVYTFAQLHFHWGPNDSVGSEHRINGKTYTMEAHFVCFNAKYGTSQEAMNYPDGLVVIAVFLQAGGPENRRFQTVVDVVKELVASDNAELTSTANDALGWLLNNFPKGATYYTYPGSLTTPPYSENVQWIVFAIVIEISSDQVQQFRELLNSNGEPITSNYREIQPLNYRKVYSSQIYTVNKNCMNTLFGC